MSVLIIAEIGVNHQGSENHAYKLIDYAVESGADCVKFQLFKPELLTDDAGRRRMLEGLLLRRDAYVRLYEYCKGKGIGFACTAFDVDSLEYLLRNTQMRFIKISSGQENNGKLLEFAEEYAAIENMEVIQSIKPDAVFEFRQCWKYLHVIPEYPTPPRRAQLWRLKHYSGLSDHSGDIFMPLAAVALGAKIIECHITLDKNQEGPDHKASLTPDQFKVMVRGIRAIEEGLA